MAFLQLNVRGRLILGFSLLCILLAAVVGTTIIKVAGSTNPPIERSTCGFQPL